MENNIITLSFGPLKVNVTLTRIIRTVNNKATSNQTKNNIVS